MSEEDTKKLYTGENRRYRETEPNYEEERQGSIERAAQIRAGKTQFNDPWEVLSDAEAEKLNTSIEKVPKEDRYVLARDGRVMHRIQLQHAVEKEIREKLGVPEPWRGEKERIAWYKRQIALLEKADAAPRCGHVYADGTGCKAPKLKQGKWCYAHTRMKQVHTKKLRLGPMEDANAVMLNLMEIGRALCDDEISERRAGLLLYEQQLGLIALKGVTFKETDPQEMIAELPEEPPADERRLPQIKPKKVSRELTRTNKNQAKESGVKPGMARRKAGVKEKSTPGLNCVSPMNSGLNG